MAAAPAVVWVGVRRRGTSAHKLRLAVGLMRHTPKTSARAANRPLSVGMSPTVATLNPSFTPDPYVPHVYVQIMWDNGSHASPFFIVAFYAFSHYCSAVTMFKELDLREAGGTYFSDVLALFQRCMDVLFYDIQMVASVVHGNRMLEGMTQVHMRSTAVRVRRNVIRVRSTERQCGSTVQHHSWAYSAQTWPCILLTNVPGSPELSCALGAGSCTTVPSQYPGRLLHSYVLAMAADARMTVCLPGPQLMVPLTQD